MHVGRPMVRALRAAVFTAVCVLASATLHVLVGGTAIALGPLAAAVAVTWTAAFCLGARPRGWPELLGLCVAAQFGLHQLFAVSEHSASATMRMPAALPGSHEHGSGLGMLMIHLAVAAASSWWLARGETALAALLHLSATPLTGLWNVLAAWPAVLAPLPLSRPVHFRPSWPQLAGHVPALLAPVLSRRGPPQRAGRG
ncbi:hypothetical protein ACQP2T_48320 [Nonomuraea sp. CA-143628]|uniref:hypothetical protein n=1 Tax=Nonomuraea sp. CA-143628 TaxID=3239997 RepID=UPI003D8D322F